MQCLNGELWIFVLNSANSYGYRTVVICKRMPLVGLYNIAWVRSKMSRQLFCCNFMVHWFLLSSFINTIGVCLKQNKSLIDICLLLILWCYYIVAVAWLALVVWLCDTLKRYFLLIFIIKAKKSTVCPQAKAVINCDNHFCNRYLVTLNWFINIDCLYYYYVVLHKFWIKKIGWQIQP